MGTLSWPREVRSGIGSGTKREFNPLPVCAFAGIFSAILTRKKDGGGDDFCALSLQRERCPETALCLFAPTYPPSFFTRRRATGVLVGALGAAADGSLSRAQSSTQPKEEAPCTSASQAGGLDLRRLHSGSGFRGRLGTGRRTGRSLPGLSRKRESPGEESPNSAGQCAG